MGQISTLFAHKVIDAATVGSGGDQNWRRALFRSVGLDPEAAVDPKRMIDDETYYGLCERVTDRDPDPGSVSIRVGSLMRCDDYGAFGLAWKSAVDLHGSYQRAVRYGRVLTSVSTYDVETQHDRVLMVLNRQGAPRRGLFISNEQTLVAVTQISREVCQQVFTPEEVFFRHQALGDTSAHLAFFGCPVTYGAEKNAIAVSPALLRSPNRLGDQSISNFFDGHMDRELAALADDQGLDRRVRIQISHALSEGVPSVSAVADRLGMSGRTLQRRLAEQGHAYQDLVDETRHDLAKRLLQRTDYALAEVAFLTGFAEQSTFTRAFKRWSGQTPATFRRGAAPA